MILKNQHFKWTEFWFNLRLALALVAMFELTLEFDKWSALSLGWSNILVTVVILVGYAIAIALIFCYGSGWLVWVIRLILLALCTKFFVAVLNLVR